MPDEVRRRNSPNRLQFHRFLVGHSFYYARGKSLNFSRSKILVQWNTNRQLFECIKSNRSTLGSSESSGDGQGAEKSKSKLF